MIDDRSTIIDHGRAHDCWQLQERRLLPFSLETIFPVCKRTRSASSTFDAARDSTSQEKGGSIGRQPLSLMLHKSHLPCQNQTTHLDPIHRHHFLLPATLPIWSMRNRPRDPPNMHSNSMSTDRCVLSPRRRPVIP